MVVFFSIIIIKGTFKQFEKNFCSKGKGGEGGLGDPVLPKFSNRRKGATSINFFSKNAVFFGPKSSVIIDNDLKFHFLYV